LNQLSDEEIIKLAEKRGIRVPYNITGD
jgi:hypothetical protein